MSDATKSKAKQKWAVEKPKLDNARQLRGIFFIELEDEKFKHTMKNARRKLGIPIPAAMPGKTPINSGGETYCGSGKARQHMLVLSNLTSPREFDWKELLIGMMRIILQQKK